MSLAKPIDLQDRASHTTINVRGEAFICDWDGCLYWREQELLVVSDLHLEKGSSFARKGIMVPPYDTGETLVRLAERIKHWRPKTIISLGDSFHDEDAHERVPQQYWDQLRGMMLGVNWIWISGNHDPTLPADLGGTFAHEIAIGQISFRHEPQQGEAKGEIAGHLHPKGKINRRFKSVTRPCFVSDGKRLIMPAFGAYTGGLNIRHKAFKGMLNEASLSAVLLGNKRVFHIAGKNLIS